VAAAAAVEMASRVEEIFKNICKCGFNMLLLTCFNRNNILHYCTMQSSSPDFDHSGVFVLPLYC
jgi:hypothetical protein